ncbi:nodulation protein NodH [Sulfitobacter pseudonitzschiae]|uniref:Nodulation protein NodH n=1 Tax=Pseudosulfitobacter pseudonitzschiae TaxID=1402135 RepID=A0A9Q2NDT2_9RHOB|nr:sulfotransferase family 2 domain-containing protein [Pseudosulfitobacter pseudonitzschiae]MBM2290737.1 nodulation protein NodH [Pseudosulfitobacter pseudonitzschiae]MBM2295655.1 nodulation protein NodH [Pseudosulfitobacter pseudonitzschiae]MBM2300567.1 nodulation protein NodH [Pseudosulfitobacter pseudonitzschiae]MBM2310352.1 nodulation protein NodH [Pseudosulfitobacter pseudonitzschiae]MBM2315264.1 nodulation protein NodH [Pseudosulfitobacter pseudonitzschiae]
MAQKFDCFVVFAEMRTGSNFLETNLNAFDGITCHGEAFNPHFIGYPNVTEILGVTQASRDADPKGFLKVIRKQTDGLGGFRYFHDHDARVFDAIVDDPKCAKIVLTRNPVDSYVSWKIAQATGQWKLTDVKRRKEGAAEFDATEFEAHLEALQSFQVLLMNRLQVSGQTAFYVAYEDLQSVEVMNGLAAYLGVDSRLEGLDKSLKKQNPSPITEKVTNADEMAQALNRLDRFNLTRTPNFEPRRGAVIPTYVAAAKSPLLYLPMRSGPEDQIYDWMAALDGVGADELLHKMSQKDLRQWKRRNRGHRSFTVLRHPAARAHHAFCHRILNPGPDCYDALRQTLIRRYALPIPQEAPGASYDRAAHHRAFTAFLEFLKGNLAGQTAIRVDAAWCTQTQAVQGFGDFVLPDRIIREENLQVELADIAAQIGVENVPQLPPVSEPGPFTLKDIYDDSIESLVSDVYQRDYMMFGFSRWA